MYGWRGILTGALALIVAQAVVSGAGADHVGGLFGFVNELAARFIDPKVPAIGPRTAAPLAPPAGATYVLPAGAQPAAPGAPATKEGAVPPLGRNNPDLLGQLGGLFG